MAAVRGIGFEVRRGECVASVGESGSGKSVTARTLVGLAGARRAGRARAGLSSPAGTCGAARAATGGGSAAGWIGSCCRTRWCRWTRCAPVGAEVAEVLRRAPAWCRAPARRARVDRAARRVGVPEPELRARQHPHQLSGGLRQRALIASAIAADPRADHRRRADHRARRHRAGADPRAARRAQGAGAALLLISHDLAVVARLADRVAVMRTGVIVEEGADRGRCWPRPQHPYTRLLLAAVPSAASRGHPPVRAGGRRCRRPPGTAPVDPSVDAGWKRSAARRRYGARDRASGRVASTLPRGRDPRPGRRVRLGQDDRRRGSLLGLLEPDRGHGRAATASRGAACANGRRRPLRRRISSSPRTRSSSFDPRYTVDRIVAEALRVDRAARAHAAATGCVELLDQVGLGASVLRPPAARAVRRAAPAGRDRPGAGAPARPCWSATSRCPPSTCRCRRRCWTCWPTCRAARASPSCSSRTTSAWCTHRRPGPGDEATAGWWRRARSTRCSPQPAARVHPRAARGDPPPGDGGAAGRGRLTGVPGRPSPAPLRVRRRGHPAFSRAGYGVAAATAAAGHPGRLWSSDQRVRREGAGVLGRSGFPAVGSGRPRPLPPGCRGGAGRTLAARACGLPSAVSRSGSPYGSRRSPPGAPRGLRHRRSPPSRCSMGERRRERHISACARDADTAYRWVFERGGRQYGVRVFGWADHLR